LISTLKIYEKSKQDNFDDTMQDQNILEAVKFFEDK